MCVFNLKRAVNPASEMYWISHLRFSSDPYFSRSGVFIREAPPRGLVHCGCEVAISDISEHDFYTKCQKTPQESQRIESREIKVDIGGAM